MTCIPCSKKKPTFEIESQYPKVTPPRDDWHVIVISKRVYNVKPLLAALNLLDVAVTLVDTCSLSGKCSCKVARYIWMPNETCIPRAINAGVRSNTRYTLVLHDDVMIPDGDAWLGVMAKSLDIGGVGMVVPVIDGDCGNILQKRLDLAAVSHTSEFVSSAAMAFQSLNLARIGFNEDMDGYDWWQVDMQAKLAHSGLVTLVAPVVFKHAGRGTYKDASEFDHNFTIMQESGVIEHELRVRPRHPRLHLKSMAKHGTWSFVVQTAAEAREAINLFKEQDELKQFAVIDCGNSAETMTAVTAAPGGWRYSAAIGDPLIHAVNIGDSQRVRVTDMRAGSRRIPVDGKRIRCGTEYRLPQQIENLHFAMLRHYALGDTLMMTPVLHAIKQKYPWINVFVHHAGAGRVLLEGNPDIAGLLTYDMAQFTPSTDVVDLGTGNGTEDTIFRPFDELGIDRPETVQLRYTITQGEREQAIAWLESKGVERDSSPYLIGIQKTGGWKVKRWANHDEAIVKFTEAGARVIVFGTEETGDNYITMSGLPLRVAVAVVSLMDGVVTFDSGMGYAAIAVRTPVVSLWGPHKPDNMMGVCGPNISCLRVRTPDKCKSEWGASCREVRGGATCPYREDGIGGDCMDEITASEVLEHMIGRRRWELPVSQRWNEWTR